MPALTQSQPPRRILVISLRFLGDTLLITPLLNSLHRAYPAAQIDVLAYANTAPMLENNPAIHKIIPIPSKPKLSEFLRLLAGVFRRYDLAISTQSGDRPTLLALAASGNNLGFVPQRRQTGWWKRYLLKQWLEFGFDSTHTVLENLRLCQPLGIAADFKLTPPRSAAPVQRLDERYAVLHIVPQWRYKQWHVAGWSAVAHFLAERGFRIVLSGSPLLAEQQLLAELLPQLPENTLNLAGQLTLGQLTELIEQADLFVGPDTGITHLAAATGTLTVALFGPTNPLIWAPWPDGYCQNLAPFAAHGSQRVNNVCLIQGESSKGCVPCQQEGCDRHRDSHSDCLNDLSAASVIAQLRVLIE